MKYNVTGMSCAACSARVEKAVSKVEGVSECSVNLLTNSMNVEGTATEAQIIQAVEKAGYGAECADSKKISNTTANINNSNIKNAKSGSGEADNELKAMLKRLGVSVVFLLALMYFSMGHMMWNWPLPKWFEGNHVAMGLVQLLL